MRRTVITAIAVSGLALGLAACSGSDSSDTSGGGSSEPTATSQSSGGGSSSKGGVDLTIAAAGAIPETHITSDEAPTSCTLTDADSVYVDIMPSAVEGLASTDFLSISRSITKVQLGTAPGMNAGNLSEYSTLKTTGSTTTLTLNDFPLNIGNPGTDTTMSGTVTCPKG